MVCARFNSVEFSVIQVEVNSFDAEVMIDHDIILIMDMRAKANE